MYVFRQPVPVIRRTLGVTWQGAAGQIGSFLPTSGNFAKASGLIGTGSQIISALGPTSGALATAGTILPIAGAAIGIAELGMNLAKCGTITSIGCTKRSDTEIDKQGEIAARKVIWAVESGQLGAATAKSYIARIWQEMLSSWAQPQRSGYSSQFDGFCGSDPAANPAYNIQIGAPANSQAVTYLCGSNGDTRQWMFQTAFPALIDRLAAARPQPPSQPVQAQSTSIPSPASTPSEAASAPQRPAPAATGPQGTSNASGSAQANSGASTTAAPATTGLSNLELGLMAAAGLGLLWLIS